MSRIHEALRKAEKEKPENGAIDTASIFSAAPFPAPTVTPTLAAGQGPSVSLAPEPEASILERLKQKCSRPEWKPVAKATVFSGDGTSSVAAEQFRTLRSRLYRLREKHPCRRVLVTSSMPAEGKTFVAANLALAIVRQHERRALLVDADLRASRLHLELGAPQTPGLSEYLRGEVDEFAVIQSSAEGNLFFVPGGGAVANPAELLASSRLKALLDRMTPIFDWIILDSPPVLPVADAGLLAGVCDGVLLVVKSGSTPFDAARKACSEFREKNLIGAVLNRAEEVRPSSSYYYHNGYTKKQ